MKYSMPGVGWITVFLKWFDYSVSRFLQTAVFVAVFLTGCKEWCGSRGVNFNVPKVVLQIV